LAKFTLANYEIPGLLQRDRSNCLEYVFEYLDAQESQILSAAVEKIKSRSSRGAEVPEDPAGLSLEPQVDDQMLESSVYGTIIKKLLYNNKQGR
jgi:hypothetical protein